MQILRTPEGKIVKVNMKEDIALYTAPVNPPNTGKDYTRGADLYVHKARSGNYYFYVYHWSMYQGEESGYSLLDKDDAKEFVLNIAQASGHAKLSDAEIEVIEEYFPHIFDEDA